jgi:hypothetical protein
VGRRAAIAPGVAGFVAGGLVPRAIGRGNPVGGGSVITRVRLPIAASGDDGSW